MNQLDYASLLFKALSEPVRLRVLNLLLHADSEICVCELIEILEVPQSVVSRHLAYLRKADLVTARRQGVWMYYSVNPQLPDLAENILSAFKLHTESDEILSSDIAKTSQSSTTCCL